MTPRYNVTVRVAIGKQCWPGMLMGARYILDARTDGYASGTYLNESLLGVAAA